jgi:hypothetical protein
MAVIDTVVKAEILNSKVTLEDDPQNAQSHEPSTVVGDLNCYSISATTMNHNGNMDEGKVVSIVSNHVGTQSRSPSKVNLTSRHLNELSAENDDQLMSKPEIPPPPALSTKAESAMKTSGVSSEPFSFFSTYKLGKQLLEAAAIAQSVASSAAQLPKRKDSISGAGSRRPSNLGSDEEGHLKQVQELAVLEPPTIVSTTEPKNPDHQQLCLLKTQIICDSSEGVRLDAMNTFPVSGNGHELVSDKGETGFLDSLPRSPTTELRLDLLKHDHSEKYHESATQSGADLLVQDKTYDHLEQDADSDHNTPSPLNEQLFISRVPSDRSRTSGSFRNGNGTSGVYCDGNREWEEAYGGYYDGNGYWIETGGYYDDIGTWTEYAGYYDERGDWVEVGIAEQRATHQAERHAAGGGARVGYSTTFFKAVLGEEEEKQVSVDLRAGQPGGVADDTPTRLYAPSTNDQGRAARSDGGGVASGGSSETERVDDSQDLEDLDDEDELPGIGFVNSPDDHSGHESGVFGKSDPAPLKSQENRHPLHPNSNLLQDPQQQQQQQQQQKQDQEHQQQQKQQQQQEQQQVQPVVNDLDEAKDSVEELLSKQTSAGGKGWSALTRILRERQVEMMHCEVRKARDLFYKKLTPYTLAGFDLTTHSSSLLGGRR